MQAGYKHLTIFFVDKANTHVILLILDRAFIWEFLIPNHDLGWEQDHMNIKSKEFRSKLARYWEARPRVSYQCHINACPSIRTVIVCVNIVKQLQCGVTSTCKVQKYCSHSPDGFRLTDKWLCMKVLVQLLQSPFVVIILNLIEQEYAA